jgi:hypothetical protein
MRAMGIKDYWIYRSIIENTNLKNSRLLSDSFPKNNLGKLFESVNKDLTINDLSFLAEESSMLDYFFKRLWC